MQIFFDILAIYDIITITILRQTKGINIIRKERLIGSAVQSPTEGMIDRQTVRRNSRCSGCGAPP